MNETTRRIMQQMNSTRIVEGPTGPKGDKGDKGSDGINGTGVLVYPTLSALQTAFPSGTNIPVWVTEENSWYYWGGTVESDTTAPVVTASVTTGTYASAQSITLSANEAATIYYTLDGSTPTISSSAYSTALSVSSNTTLKYFGKDTAGNSSAVQTQTYTITAPDTTAPTVTASPGAGTFTAVQSVTLSANETATIYYTTDGSTPTTNSTVYSSPIAVNSTKTLKFFGKDTANNSSTVQTAVYTINLADTTAPNPVTALSAGTPTSDSVPLTWTISSSGDVSTQEVAYSTNGTTYTVFGSALSASATGTTITGLTASTAYTFRVVAIDVANNRSTSVTTTATTAAASGVPNLQLYLHSDDLIGTTMPASGADLTQGVVWIDRSGNSRTVTITRQWNWSPSNWNALTTSTGLTLEEINATNLPNFSALSSGIFTWEFCVKMDTSSSDDYNFFISNDNPWFKYRPSGTGSLNYQTGTGNYYLDQTLAAKISDGLRHHVMFIADGTDVKVYVDNVQVHTHAAVSASQGWSNVKVVIGHNGGVYTNKMRVVRYYDKALNSTERTTNFNECMA